LSLWWPMLDEATRVAAQHAVVEYMHRLVYGADSATRSVNAVSAGSRHRHAVGGLGPDEIAPFVWSVATMTRLVTDAQLSRLMIIELERRLAESLPGGRPSSGADFTTASIGALAAIIPDLVGNPDDRVAETWTAWLAALEAAAGGSGGGPAASLKLSAIESMLNGPISPATDRDVREAVHLLLASLDWTSDSADGQSAHRQFLEWLDDQSIDSDALSVVSRWLINESAAPGLGSDFLVEATATPRRRAELRNAYAAAWDLGVPVAADALTNAWGREAASILARSPDESEILGPLADAALIARLNHAASAIWRGERIVAERLLSDLRRDVEVARRTSANPIRRDVSGDGAWAVNFMETPLSNVDGRIRLLQQIERRGAPLGPVDADVIAETALVGGPAPVKSAAARIILSRAEEVWVLNAVLEALPRAPRTADTASFIEAVTNARLPALRHSEWDEAASRAVLGVLLERLSASGEYAAADRLAALLADAYRGVDPDAFVGPDSVGSASGDVSPDPARAAEAIWRHWLTVASNQVQVDRDLPSIATIERRRAGRLELADGPLQRFAAMQASVTELLAYIVASEQAGRAGEILSVLDELSLQRRSATHVIQQIEAAERAMLRLWLIRLNLQAPNGEAAR
ncbi:MAG: hypothetical protein VYC34_01405, partial [Planctomycetota bacterium]|nr:hypothetical protein [Planctomycetota bacterium]